MAVRDSSELGPIINKVAEYLARNEDLGKYLVYTDIEPLTHDSIPPYDLLGKNIFIVPQINAKDFTTAAKICLIIPEGDVSPDNDDYKNLTLNVLVYVPLKSWIINSEQLRPFAIIGEIEKSLKGKKIETLGKSIYHGFHYEPVDDNIGCYVMTFSYNVFN